MAKLKFDITPDGDVITTSKNIPQSGYFLDLNDGYAMTIDGDKYRANGDGQRATKIDTPLSEISDVPPWL